VAPLWYLAQLTFNASLHLTSVTSNTVLSSTAALFTYIFSVVLLSEPFTLRKLGFVGLLIAGTAMVTLADTTSEGDGEGVDDSSGKQSLIGDLLCLVSAVIYGAYTVAVRRFLEDDEKTPMTLFFGYMGGLILMSIGPILVILHVLGAMSWGALSWKIFGAMVVKGLLDNVLSDYLWARSILLVGPTVATSGLSMQVPLAVTLDAVRGTAGWLSGGAMAAVLTLGGGVVVLAGFFGITLAEAVEEGEHHNTKFELMNEDVLQRQLEEEEQDDEEVAQGIYTAGDSTTNGFRNNGSSSHIHNGGIEGGGGGAVTQVQQRPRSPLETVDGERFVREKVAID
jgi:solute carrier family 35, member F5